MSFAYQQKIAKRVITIASKIPILQMQSSPAPVCLPWAVGPLLLSSAPLAAELPRSCANSPSLCVGSSPQSCRGNLRYTIWLSNFKKPFHFRISADNRNIHDSKRGSNYFSGDLFLKHSLSPTLNLTKRKMWKRRMGVDRMRHVLQVKFYRFIV